MRQQLDQAATRLHDLGVEPIHLEITPIANDDPLRRVEQQKALGHVVDRSIEPLLLLLEPILRAPVLVRQLTHDQESHDSDQASREDAKDQENDSFPPPAGERRFSVEPDNDVEWIARQMLDREQPVSPFHCADGDTDSTVLSALELVEDTLERPADNRINPWIACEQHGIAAKQRDRAA